MLRIITIVILILGSSLNSCNKARISMSSQNETPDNTDTDKSIDAVSSPATEVVASDSPFPKQWPQCWLSQRLAVKTSFRVAGSHTPMGTPATYTRSDGRQEFKSTSYNPTTTGNCILNWFDDDTGNTDEPWVALFKQKFPNYRAVVTCTASPTPRLHVRRNLS